MKTLTCPSCGAMCDPDTHRCLRCNIIHSNFTGGTLDFEKREPQWFSFPVVDSLGRQRLLTLYATVNYQNTSRQLVFTVQKPPQKDGAFLSTTNALEN